MANIKKSPTVTLRRVQKVWTVLIMCLKLKKVSVCFNVTLICFSQIIIIVNQFRKTCCHHSEPCSSGNVWEWKDCQWKHNPWTERSQPDPEEIIQSRGCRCVFEQQLRLIWGWTQWPGWSKKGRIYNFMSQIRAIKWLEIIYCLKIEIHNHKAVIVKANGILGSVDLWVSDCSFFTEGFFIALSMPTKVF